MTDWLPDVELAAGLLLVGLAGHVAERIYSQVLVQVRAEVDHACYT